ncbi:SusC/RagA family TonB-linked outer membrane protein [Pedobacter hiemivivus]|uniref:SusC/RagA family TonB-linked outer membrane protein n=1 Tax=Pedobacter hiemivivus TaxID=2530454 RepID=A0A4R0MV84_9SPHI|nr:SusC/RagA family TonB-linked outer membrane protein [Pedobacter hiemivivus]TCC91055.1 SusC/RagA family TonB-linked outer membrane protein [Pedobacter hiemivivus]
MKFFTLSLIFICLLTSIQLFGQKPPTITLSLKNVPLEKVLAQIKKQTGITFAYNKEVLKTAGKLSVQAEKADLETVLKACFQNTTINYTIFEKTVVLSNKNDDNGNITTDGSFFSKGAVHGFVYDSNKKNLSGASVIIKRTHLGSMTNAKGEFRIQNVRTNDTLSISFIGYNTQNVPVQGRTDISVLMMETKNDLDGVMVQAYGITSKRLATGNISRVTAEEIAKQPVMNPLLALQGRVPGLVISQNNGNASAPVKVEIRGRNSVNQNFSSEPLFIIDGIPLTVLDVKHAPRTNGVSPGFAQGGFSPIGGQSPLFNINPKDIESIEVLKDGDATAIYGSRAANGVILITTKRAKPGKTTFNMDLTQGITDVPPYPRMMNTREYLAMRREAFKNDGIQPTAANAPDLVLWDTTRYTNWQKELLGTGSMTSVSAGLSGGDARTTFGINTNYTEQADQMARSGANQRATIAFNAFHRSLDQKLAVTLFASYAFSKVDAIIDPANIFSLPPNAPPIFNSKGKPNYAEWNSARAIISYPFSYIFEQGLAKNNLLTSGLNINYELIKGISLSVNAGYNNALNSNNFFNPIASQNPLDNPIGGAIFGKTNNSNWNIEPQLTYSGFISKGNLSVLVAGSLQNTNTSASTINSNGYTSDALLKSVNNATYIRLFEASSLYKYTAVFGRINYNWENKYILNLNVRRDGSSRFALDRQFGNFGSLGLAWIASEEKWMKKILPSAFSFVKFRGSYALTGSDKIGDYEYLSQWSAIDPAYNALLHKYDGIGALIPIHAVNQQYRWESNKQLEGAMSLGFLKDRISLDVAYYRKRAGNQLTLQQTPIHSGFSVVRVNSTANVQNSGLDLSFSAKLIEKKDMNWSVSFNIGANQNKLLSYPGLEFTPDARIYSIGKSLSVRHLLHYIGIDPQTGTYSYEDYDKNGEIRSPYNASFGTTPGDDRMIEQDGNQNYSGGINSNFGYKNFSLSLGFDFTRQSRGTPFLHIIPGSMLNLYLPEEVRNNRWQKPGDIAKYPRYSVTSPNTLEDSDGAYTDASYLRLNNVSLSYALPAKLVKKAGMQSCAFSFNIQNIFTLTRYKGIDPTVDVSSNVPNPRLFTTSLSFNF